MIIKLGANHRKLRLKLAEKIQGKRTISTLKDQPFSRTNNFLYVHARNSVLLKYSYSLGSYHKLIDYLEILKCFDDGAKRYPKN